MDAFLDRLVGFTEALLTWRRVRLHKKKERQRQKNPVLDWLEAFLWAAMVVLLINQYVLQAYQIPSESMKETLLISDRIFVNKYIFGPELLPGVGKLPGFVSPRRGEIIIFENPSYLSQGPLFDILQRVLYMLTLSIVDIDRDESGQPKAHFLIKRAVGMGGDRIRQRDGNLEFLPQGETRWIPEKEFQGLAGLNYGVQRLVKAELYPTIRAAGEAAAYQDMRLPAPPEEAAALERLREVYYADGFAYDQERTRTLYAMNPHDRRYGARWRLYEEGTYIPEGHILPLGDNRDNSRDGRFFGSIASEKVLGRAMFRYWPLSRFGLIQ